MKKLILALFLLNLAACATGVPPDKKAAIRTVGIVSAIGDPITFKTVGLMVFTNEENKAAVPEWRLDELVTGRIADSLRGRYDVRTVQFRKEKFLPETVGLLGLSRNIGDVVRAEVSPKGLDAYIVVEQYQNGDVVPNSNQTLEGLGLYRRWSPFGGMHWVYAGYIISVIDGRDFKKIGAAITRVPVQEVDKSLWAPSLAEMTEDQKRKFRDALVALLEKDLQEKLRKLDL